MTKSKVSTIKIVGAMMLFSIIIISLFWYFLSAREPSEEVIQMENEELQALLQKDLDISYPATPRDVAKTYSRMLKCLYSGINEEDAKLLGMKMRELYDVDFLENNPESQYLDSISSEVALKVEQNATIVQYSVGSRDSVQYTEVGNTKLATIGVIYTMKNNGIIEKSAEKIYLRLDDENRWKIYGWELITASEIDKNK